MAPNQRHVVGRPQVLSLPRAASLPSLAPVKCPAKFGDTRAKGGTRETRSRRIERNRERHWLRGKAKYGYLDFSDVERAEMHRYFNALSGEKEKMSLDVLENMLISLGLVETREEVAEIVQHVGDSPGELGFEQYLEIVNSQSNSYIVKVFKAMSEGRLGDQNLNFQTVLSSYRRKLMLVATGARSAEGEQKELGFKVLENFAALQRARHEDVLTRPPSAAIPASDGTLELAPASFQQRPDERAVGPLELLWRGVCQEHGLYYGYSRPNSADGQHRRTREKPQTPEAVIQGVMKGPTPRARSRLYNQTIVIQAPALEEGGLTG